MKGVILFAIVGLLAAGVCATGIQFEQLDPKAVLAEFDATPFGNTLVSMIAVHLSTNGPLDELIVLLQNVDSSIKKAQKEADEKNTQVQGECETQIGGFKRQISTATGAITQFTKTRDTTQASLDIANQDLRETLASLQTNAQRLSQGQAERDAQHQQYAKSQGEAEAAIKALDAALQLIGHLQSGSSFVQLKKRFDKVTSDLLEVARGSKSQSHLYTPLIEALAELAQKATPETLQKITALFNKLRSKFVKSQQVGTQTENTQMTAWTSLKVDLETEKDALQDKRRGLESQIDGYNKVISDCVKAIQYNQGQLKNAQDNLRRTKKYCKIQADTYKKNTAERTRELSIIQKAVQFFRNRAKGISDAIKNSRGL